MKALLLAFMGIFQDCRFLSLLVSPNEDIIELGLKTVLFVQTVSYRRGQEGHLIAHYVAHIVSFTTMEQRKE